jgi:hypothetical protein
MSFFWSAPVEAFLVGVLLFKKPMEGGERVQKLI